MSAAARVNGSFGVTDLSLKGPKPAAWVRSSTVSLPTANDAPAARCLCRLFPLTKILVYIVPGEKQTLRALEVRTLPKQRLEGLLVFFVVLKSVDIHGVVDD